MGYPNGTQLQRIRESPFSNHPEKTQSIQNFPGSSCFVTTPFFPRVVLPKDTLSSSKQSKNEENSLLYPNVHRPFGLVTE